MNQIRRRTAWLVVLSMAAIALATQGLAQTGAQTKIEGLIADFTADLDGAGPWRVLGEWSLEIKGNSGKADFSASISMVRADNPARMAHTHHVGLTDADVTPVAGGYRITGFAVIASNGNLAGFSGSQVTVDVNGGNTVPHSNVRLTFFDAATGHFGTEPLDGVVTRAR